MISATLKRRIGFDAGDMLTEDTLVEVGATSTTMTVKMLEVFRIDGRCFLKPRYKSKNESFVILL